MVEQIFNSKKAVHTWLVGEEGGYQISLSRFYDHCKLGLLRPRKSDGKYTLKAVKEYASINVKKKETGQKETEWERKVRYKKLEMSLEREEIDLETSRLTLEKKQGKTIPREEFELAVVARAVAFMAHLNHTIYQSAADWVDLVEGDQALVPQLVDAISKAVEQRMGDFAADAEFDIIMEANE